MSDLKNRNLAFLSRKGFSFTPPETRKNVEILPSKKGDPTLRYNSGRKWIFLHSFYNPVEEARNMIKAHRNTKIDLLVVFGLGLGYPVRELLAANPGIRNLILVETDPEIFDAALETVNLEDMIGDRGLAVLLGSDIEAFQAGFCGAWQAMSPGNFLLFEHLPSKKVFFEFYLRAREFFMTCCVPASNWDEIHLQRARNQNNILSNVRSLLAASDLKPLSDRFSGQNVLLVFGSRFKSDILEMLKHVQRRALIFADIEAAPALVRHGVVPHLVLCASEAPVELEAETAQQLVRGSHLLITPSANTELLAQLHGAPAFSIGFRNGTLAWLRRQGFPMEETAPPEHLVGLMFEQAIKFGAASVVFICRIPPDQHPALAAQIKKIWLNSPARCFYIVDETTQPIDGVDPKTTETLSIQLQHPEIDAPGILAAAHRAGRIECDTRKLLDTIQQRKTGLDGFIGVIARADEYYSLLTRDLDARGPEFLEECHVQSVHMERMKYEILAHTEVLDFIEPQMHPEVLLQSRGNQAMQNIADDLQRVKAILRNDQRLYHEMHQAAQAVSGILAELLSPAAGAGESGKARKKK